MTWTPRYICVICAELNKVKTQTNKMIPIELVDKFRTACQSLSFPFVYGSDEQVLKTLVNENIETKTCFMMLSDGNPGKGAPRNKTNTATYRFITGRKESNNSIGDKARNQSQFLSSEEIQLNVFNDVMSMINYCNDNFIMSFTITAYNYESFANFEGLITGYIFDLTVDFILTCL